MLAGCSNSSGGGGGGSNQVVYVAGYYTSGSGKKVACYWIDGVRTDLTDGVTDDAEGRGIFVENGDVYVAGFEGTQAAYWMNGSKTSLGGTNSVANGIFVVSGTVYTAGSDNGQNDAGHWNGTNWNDYSLEAATAEGLSIYVSGSEVYVAGRYSGNQACYWRDGTKTDLAASARANSIYISGSTVYTAGYYNSGLDASYWVGTTLKPLPRGAFTVAIAYGIHVSDGTVYTAGYLDSPSYKANHWVNQGNPTILSDAPPNSIGQSIVENDGDIHVAGYYQSGGKDVAAYWKNGDKVADLTDGSSDARALSIIVE